MISCLELIECDKGNMIVVGCTDLGGERGKSGETGGEGQLGWLSVGGMEVNVASKKDTILQLICCPYSYPNKINLIPSLSLSFDGCFR